MAVAPGSVNVLPTSILIGLSPFRVITGEIRSSQISPIPLLFWSNWDVLGVRGQLSSKSYIPSPSESESCMVIFPISKGGIEISELDESAIIWLLM